MSVPDLDGSTGAFVLAVGGAAATAAALLSLIAWFGGMGIDLILAPFLFGLVLIGATIVIAPAAAVIGLPLTWLLARTRSERPWVYPAAGLVAGGGILTAVARIETYAAPYPAPELLPWAAFGAVPGFVCGALWWFLHRRHVRAGGPGE